MKTIALLLMTATGVVVGTSRTSEWREVPEWKQYFKAARVEGTFLLYDLNAETYLVYNAKRANASFIPASTNKIFNSLVLEGWQRGTFISDWSQSDYQRAKAAWSKILGLTKMLYDRGVTITAGSDFPNPWVIPGVSLHEELSLLVDAKIPPLQVIKIATLNGATALGLEREIGSVEKGKRADLVVLTADPSKEIRNTRLIEWVILGGRLLTPESMLAEKAEVTHK